MMDTNRLQEIKDRLSRVVRDENGNARVFNGRLVDDAAELLAEVERLRAELEAAKRDLTYAGDCESCAHIADCPRGNNWIDDECGCYKWRGATENGGANE